jgi:hypothetical protein
MTINIFNPNKIAVSPPLFFCTTKNPFFTFSMFLIGSVFNVLLFLVSSGGGKCSRCDRKTVSVAIAAFHRLQEKSARVGKMK